MKAKLLTMHTQEFGLWTETRDKTKQRGRGINSAVYNDQKQCVYIFVKF
jgi:hypothetical protein